MGNVESEVQSQNTECIAASQMPFEELEKEVENPDNSDSELCKKECERILQILSDSQASFFSKQLSSKNRTLFIMALSDWDMFYNSDPDKAIEFALGFTYHFYYF